MNESSTSTSISTGPVTDEKQVENGQTVSKAKKRSTRKRSAEPNADELALKRRIADERSIGRDDAINTVTTHVEAENYGASSLDTAEDPTGIEALFRDVSRVTDLMTEYNVKLTCDENEIFTLLEERLDRADRVKQVIELLTRRAVDKARNSSSDEVSIESVIQLVLAERPTADPNHIYQLLEEIHGFPLLGKPSSDTIRAVINKLEDYKSTQGLPSNNAEPSLMREIDGGDPLLDDLKRIASILPEVNQDEVYTYLDLYRDHPDRVQLVINNMMRGNSTVIVDGSTNRNQRDKSSSSRGSVAPAATSSSNGAPNDSSTASSSSTTTNSTSVASSGAADRALISSPSPNGASNKATGVATNRATQISNRASSEVSNSAASGSSNGASTAVSNGASSEVSKGAASGSSNRASTEVSIVASSEVSNEAVSGSSNGASSGARVELASIFSRRSSTSKSTATQSSTSDGVSTSSSRGAADVPSTVSECIRIDSDDNGDADDNGGADDNGVIYINGSETGESSSSATAEADRMAMVVNLFPDCDTEFIKTRLAAISEEPYGLDDLVTELFEGNYPKLQVKQDTEQQRLQRERLMKLEMDNVEAYLELVPDPEKIFFAAAGSAAVSDSYREHAMCQLYNDFPLVGSASLTRTLKANQSRYANSWLQLKQAILEDSKIGQGRGKKKVTLQYIKNKRPAMKMPNEPCEVFYRELQYVRNRDTVLDYIKNKESVRVARLEQARLCNELQTCSCCYDDEVLFEEMEACSDGHLFCRECVKRSVEVAVGEDKANYSCLDDSCKQEFPLSTLRRVLPSKILSLCLRKMQDEAIRLADIDNLVSCPFCPFSTIMDDPNDKLFRCLNPQCLRESCRLCREPNHIPMRCNEIEKSSEKAMRTYIEAQMSEAMIRECHKCHRRFYKVEGCNKMTCVCGASMCYVCREPIKDYSHFDNNGGCAQMSNMDQLHTDEMMKAAQEAQKKYIKEHPEASEVVLKHDPIKLIQADKKTKGRKR